MNDTELIQQTLQGNPIAFGRLMERYYDKVLLYTASLLRDYFEAEEVTQDAFLRGYHRLRELKDPNSFLPWMIRIAHNMALKRLRRRRDLQVIPIEELEEEIADEKSFEDELLRREAEEIFYEAMEGLCEEDRGMLWGRLSGESYRELSKRYGKSVGAVKMRVRRAKEKVREKVLRRLSGIVIFPWGKIGRMIGGVVMKATTKVAITGAVVMMLAGAGIWLSHRGGEKPMPKANEVKVERRVSVRAPAMVTSRPEEKEEDDFTFEEFNRLLDECLPYLDEGEKEDVREVAGESDETQEPLETQVSDETPSQGEGSKPDQERQRQIEELKERILQAAERYREILIRRKLLSQGKKYLFPDLTPEQENREYRQTQYELFDALLGYWALTEDLDPYLPGGWIYETVSGMASIRIGISSRGDECPVIGFTDDIARE